MGVAGGKTQAFEICRLRDIVAGRESGLRGDRRIAVVTVVIDIDESQEFSMQRFRMERVFLNLIGNALEAMTAGGTLRIGARQEGDLAGDHGGGYGARHTRPRFASRCSSRSSALERATGWDWDSRSRARRCSITAAICSLIR